MRTQEPLYILEDLFRVGNVEGPRLDHVRERDLTMVYRNGQIFVLPHTGGISAFNQIHPELKGIWWRCPAGTLYSEELQIICDRERGGLRHYSIQPAHQMELQEFQAILRQFAQSFERIEAEE